LSGDDHDPDLDAKTLARNIDALKLSKKDVRAVLKALKTRWSKNPIANAKYIAVITALQGGLLVLSEQTFQAVWGDMLKALNKLIILNGTVGAERPDVKLMRDNLIRDIERGEL